MSENDDEDYDDDDEILSPEEWEARENETTADILEHFGRTEDEKRLEERFPSR